jgi:hypothetical protein
MPVSGQTPSDGVASEIKGHSPQSEEKRKEEGMKRLALSAMLGIAMVATAAAQSGSGSTSSTGSGSSTSGSSSTSSQDQSSTSGAYGNTSASAKTDNKSGKKADITGCISSQGGSYYLVDKKHPSGVQLLSSEDLSAHVGHKVQVKGSWEAATGSSASSAGPSSSASSTNPSGSASASGSTSAPDTSASAGTSGTSSGSASSLPQSDQGANQAIRVSEIKMKSDKCEAGNNTNPK